MVGFFALRNHCVLPRFAPIEFGINEIEIQLQLRGAAVDDTADSCAMRFAESGEPEKMSYCVHGGKNMKNRQDFCNFAAVMEKKSTNNIKIKNKRATFEYFLVETLTAGIVLTGTEIKSIRGGKASLADSYCSFKGDELFVIGMHIAEYAQGTYNNHDPKRDRKLLLNARELRKLKNKVQEKGFTIVPVMLFINENGLAKLDIALARGKHYYDKRESLKTKDSKRELERMERY